MAIWAIADLHLPGARPGGRERAADRWRDHVDRVERAWREAVGPGDLVLLPGDVSMARNHRDVQADLGWLDRLPGIKVLSRGNHDAWFNGVEAVRPMMRRSMAVVGGDAVPAGGVVVCGTLGAPVLDEGASDADREAEGRELAALDRALEAAARLRDGDRPVYVLWHYPPFDAHRRPGPCVARFEAAGVTACVYGHIHTQGQWAAAAQGVVGGVRYHCAAADAVGFRPIRVDRAPTVLRR